ncbi:MAG: hypothetical protein V3T58_03075 [Candidatus Hydrothermarchaeales archaeon]
MSNFISEQEGAVPFSALAMAMLLLAGVAIYHFSDMDLARARQRNLRTADMDTFYGTAQVVLDVQQAVRETAEKVIMNSSIATYENPIDVDQWHSGDGYSIWKETLRDNLEREIGLRILEFYAHDDATILEKRYRSHSTDFDFSNFIGGGETDNFEVEVVPDEFTMAQKELTVKFGFSEHGIISSKNRFTGHTMSMKAGSEVAIDVRPFTMADKVYNFTGIFKRNAPDVWDFSSTRDTVDEFAWYIWAAEEVVGLLEANLRHEIRFATDERATYSLAHMIIAYKEMQHFGTFDYLHTLKEVLRPWIGQENRGKEFLSLLRLGIESGYVDQALGMMESGQMIEKLYSSSQKTNHAILHSIAYLDSSLVSQRNVPFDYFPPANEIPTQGAVQQLRIAHDIALLREAASDVEETLVAVEEAEYNPGRYDSAWLGTIEADGEMVEAEYSEFRGAVRSALESSKAAGVRMQQVKDALIHMRTTLDDGKCESILAGQLWYGGDDGNQGLKGMREILPLKEKGAEGFIEEIATLQEMLLELKYDDRDGALDEEYEETMNKLRAAKKALSEAGGYRNYYYSCRDYWGTSHSRPTSGCEESRTESETYSCGTEKEPRTCTTYWKEYRCTCKSYYRDEYTEHMSKALEKLPGVLNGIYSMDSSITRWFKEHSYDKTMDKIPEIHGFASGTGIASFYYNHHESELPGEGYTSEFEVNLNLKSKSEEIVPALSYEVGDAIGEEFADYGYAYIHATISGIYGSFHPSGVEMEYSKAREILEKMRGDGFFDFLTELLDMLSALLNYAGDIEGALVLLERESVAFPNLMEHLYTTLPPPPFGRDNQGFSILHDIRLRVDNHPLTLKFTVPLLGDVEFELPPGSNPQGGKGYSIPLPFTPIHIYSWGFDIVRSQVGNNATDPGETGEKSILRVIDYENQGNIAPLAEMSIGDERLPAPVYLHKPVMYKYEFTAGDYEDEYANHAISKGLKSQRLPPVIVIALGPFVTNFGSWEEPPDSGKTLLSIDVEFSKPYASEFPVFARVRQDHYDGEMKALVRIYETAAGRSNQVYPKSNSYAEISLDRETPVDIEVKESALSLLKSYGWSLLNADAYIFPERAVEEEIKDRVSGEDHASIPLIDPELDMDVRISKIEQNKILMSNFGNRRVDVTLTSSHKGKSCGFFRRENIWSKNLWEGTMEAGESRWVDAAIVGSVTLSLDVDVPGAVLRALENVTSVHAEDIRNFP